MVLFLVTDAGCFSIEGIVLLFGDRNLLAGAADVDEVGLCFTIVFFVFHGETSEFRVVPEPEVSLKRA